MAIMKDGLKPSFKITVRVGPKLMEEFLTNRSIRARGVVLYIRSPSTTEYILNNGPAKIHQSMYVCMRFLSYTLLT